MHNSSHLVQPQPAAGCLDNAGDRTEWLAPGTIQSPESSLIEQCQSEFTADPDVLPLTANDLNPADVRPVGSSVYGSLSSIH